MKQEMEEKTIKELFQRLKHEDDRRAPSFADSWAAAQSRLKPSGQSVRAQALNWPRWSLAVFAAILMILGFIVYHVIQNDPQKAGGVITGKAPAPKPAVERKEQIEKVKLGQRRRSHTPSPTSFNWPRLNEPIITDSMPVYSKRSEYATDFILLSYGDVQKPMESGELIRLQMPRSALIAFGLPVNVEQADAPVKADLLLGEDGMARAIRFVR
ncbi:MAG: hypothetical protein J2P21_29740 [Chloracidobacterium sp.]|nr:hypothetical protein [Chloracidobacterium sp.]